jgi:hypothetical protein
MERMTMSGSMVARYGRGWATVQTWYGRMEAPLVTSVVKRNGIGYRRMVATAAETSSVVTTCRAA